MDIIIPVIIGLICGVPFGMLIMHIDYQHIEKFNHDEAFKAELLNAIRKKGL